MDFYPNQAGDGTELLDLLFDKDDGILRHENMKHPNLQPWLGQDLNTIASFKGVEDILNNLISGTDTASQSPSWLHSPSDSGISEDPHSDQNDSPSPPASPHVKPCHVSPITQHALDHTVNDGWLTGVFLEGQSGTQQVLDVPQPQQATSFPLTIKDLLLSSTPEPPQQAAQQSCQELVLNEDEKKLLIKEGVTLPSQFPLTRYEERLLKKIRRKIRNKQSAQESRKKKKEYMDGLESRMAACSEENQELQRKVFHLEKCNMSLMEQLRRLQALIMNGSNKQAQTATCALVLLLSFTLILLPSLKPFTETKVSQSEDFSPLRVQSRSLHNLQSSRVLHALEHPYSVLEEAKPHPGFPEEEAIHDITTMEESHRGHGLTGFDLGSHNASLVQYGDPITGHVAAVTLNPHRSARLKPHADDM